MKKSSRRNILSFRDYHLNKVLEEVKDTFQSLREDYDVEVLVSISQVHLILNRFYDYYEKKKILFSFDEVMIGHFHDMAIDAIDSGCIVDVDFVLNELRLYELLDSQIEVNPIDTKKIVKELRKKINGRRQV